MKPLPRFRRVGLLPALVAILIASGPAVSAASPVTRPNILFIMVDEMRWDALTCAGHPFVRTPHLDTLAREGTRFATAYTCAPVCVPSRYSHFSGRYAHVHGSLGNAMPANAAEVLLPDLLRHLGYETAISGKLHFLPQNLAHGFDHFCVMPRPGLQPGGRHVASSIVRARFQRESCLFADRRASAFV